jgi:hypothetical protein
MTIELRLTEVDPPAAEPLRTIYHDIASLPDPVVQAITVRYFNYDDVSLYFKITGSGTGYTFTPANLGLLASGANAYKNLDAFASRARPTSAQLPNGEMGESIVLTLMAYTDSGYTNLKWTFNRTVTVIWLNSGDAAFTVDVLNNFDDGTVQGWATKKLSGFVTAVISVAGDYVLSPACSLKDTAAISGWTSDTRWLKYIEIINGTTAIILIHCGQLYDGVQANYVPINRWIRIVVPLPPNTTLELQIAYDELDALDGTIGNVESKNCFYKSFTTANKSEVYAIIDVRLSKTDALLSYTYMWIDDFKIISK